MIKLLQPYSNILKYSVLTRLIQILEFRMLEISFVDGQRKRKTNV